MNYLRLGIAGMSGGERELLANSAEAIDMQKLAKADPELFAVISSGNDASAGYLIPADTMQAIEMAQLAYSGMLEAPTTKFTTANGREIPYPVTDDTGNAGAWIEESGDHSSATDPTYQVRKLGAHILSSKIVRVPIQFLTDAAINFEAHLNELFGERLGRAKNTAFTTGNGVGRPTGIVTGAYLGVTGGSSTAVTFDELTDLEHSLNRAHPDGFQHVPNRIKQLRTGRMGIHESHVRKPHPEQQGLVGLFDRLLFCRLSEPIGSNALVSQFSTTRQVVWRNSGQAQSGPVGNELLGLTRHGCAAAS